MGIDEHIDESKNWFERAAEHVPGYKGYKDKELRREADKILRDYLAELLDGVGHKLEEFEFALSRRADLGALGLLDTTLRKLRTLRDRIQFADYGYAGLFDTTKVNAAKLDQLYQFDLNLQQEAKGLRDLVAALGADSPSLQADIHLLDDRLEVLNAYFAEREHLITGAGGE